MYSGLRRNKTSLKMKYAFTVAMFFILTFTAIGQQQEKENIPYAELVFYRSYIPYMNAPLKKVPIYVNDALVNHLKANTIIRIKLFSEGKNYVAIDKKSETRTLLNIKFGTTYYFKCEVIAGLWFGKPIFHQVDPDIGKAECEELENKLIQKNNK